MFLVFLCRLLPLIYVKLSFKSSLISNQFVLLIVRFPFSLWKTFNILFAFSQYSIASNTSDGCVFYMFLNIPRSLAAFKFSTKCCFFSVTEMSQYSLFSSSSLNKRCTKFSLGNSVEYFETNLLREHRNKCI